jgi:hypothetical protein
MMSFLKDLKLTSDIACSGGISVLLQESYTHFSDSDHSVSITSIVSCGFSRIDSR